jgi:hypothetical protein
LTALPVLKADPDWIGASQILIDGCAHAPHAQARVDVLERLCIALGDSLYPAFLNVLSLIGERGSPSAQSAVAEGLVDALRSGRLPSGKRSAWGAASSPTHSHSRAPTVSTVSLGPIEYLCAEQPQGAGDASSGFSSTLTALLRLVNHNDRARQLYIARLQAIAQDPLDGGLSRSTRQVLQALADAWSRATNTPAQVVDAAVQALPRRNSLAQFGQASWR